MKTLQKKLADGSIVNVKVVGYYSPITQKIHKRKSDRTQAENRLRKKQEAEKYQSKVEALQEKFNQH